MRRATRLAQPALVCLHAGALSVQHAKCVQLPAPHVQEASCHDAAYAWQGSSLGMRPFRLQVIRDKATLLSRGFAFVTYTSAYSAASAMQHMNGVPLFQGLYQGRALKVGPSHRC